MKKGWKILIVCMSIAVLAGFIGAAFDEHEAEPEAEPEPEVIYEWVELQPVMGKKSTILTFNEPMPVFELPRGTERWRVIIVWWGGSKDSTLAVAVFKWGEIEDERIKYWTNRGSLGLGAAKKKGTDTLEFKPTWDNGKMHRKHYVNIASAAGLGYGIKVEARVPIN